MANICTRVCNFFACSFTRKKRCITKRDFCIIQWTWFLNYTVAHISYRASWVEWEYMINNYPHRWGIPILKDKYSHFYSVWARGLPWFTFFFLIDKTIHYFYYFKIYLPINFLKFVLQLFNQNWYHGISFIPVP